MNRKPKDTRPNASKAYVQKVQRKAQRLMNAAQIAAKMIELGYGIGDINDYGVTVFNANFIKGRDGMLDDRAEREVKDAMPRNLTAMVKGIYVDVIRPEDLIAIEVK